MQRIGQSCLAVKEHTVKTREYKPSFKGPVRLKFAC